MNSDNKKLDSKEVSKEGLDKVSGGYILKNFWQRSKRKFYEVIDDATGGVENWTKYPTKKEAKKAAAAQGYSTKELNYKKWKELWDSNF